MTKQEIKVKAADQVVEYAKTCIHKQLTPTELIETIEKLNKFYNGK
jgi:hypothetical protein